MNKETSRGTGAILSIMQEFITAIEQGREKLGNVAINYWGVTFKTNKDAYVPNGRIGYAWNAFSNSWVEKQMGSPLKKGDFLFVGASFKAILEKKSELQEQILKAYDLSR